MAIVNVTGISGITSITAQSTSLNFYDATGNTLSIGASVSGNITGNVTGNLTGNVTGNVAGNVTGAINSTGVSTITTLSATSIVGVTTAGITTVYTNSINNGQLGGSRNMIINGSMVVNQRGFTGAAGTTTSTSFGVDRFRIEHDHNGVVSAGQTTMNSTIGGNAYADGFKNAHILRITTADTSIAAGQYQLLEQFIEGYNLQGIKKGTANAQPVTLSFWVRATTTGTYIVELYDYDNARTVSKAYTINATNTWEKKTITFPADTTGAFDDDNARSLGVFWWLAAGSNYSSGTLQTSWGSETSANRAVGQVNALGTVGDFFLTGVQLEVGDRATEFERRSFGDELRLCQRYFQNIITCNANTYSGGSGAYDRVTYNAVFPVVMRSSPSVSFTGNGYLIPVGSSVTPAGGDQNGGPAAGTPLSLVVDTTGIPRAQASRILASGNTVERGVQYVNHNSAVMTASSEL